MINAFIGGMSFYGFTALVNPVATALGWSYSQISLAMSIRGLEGGILSPFLGKLADRWPAKWLVLAGTIITALGYLSLSLVTNLTMFYTSFVIIAFGGSLGVTMAPMVTTTRWFKKNLGKATGIIAAGIGVGGLTTPIITKLIDTFDLRFTMIILAIVVAVIGIPMAFVFRSRPEDYNMLPDGTPQNTMVYTNKHTQHDFGMKVREVIKTRAFWHFGIASFCQVAAASAVIIHMMPYLTSLGIERATASMIAMFVSLVSIPTRLVYGWLADIFTRKYVFAVSNVLTSLGLFFFSIVGDGSFIIIVLFIIFFSFGLAGLLPTRTPIIREYFGIKNFGAIFGITFIFLTFGTVLSPPIAGWVYDLRGGYDPYWLLLSGVVLVGAISSLTMPPPPQHLGNVSNP